MSDLLINRFMECLQCGECCDAPCDIIPQDLPRLLERFQLSLSDFYKRYLIALVVKSPRYSGEILMMVPVKVNSQGVRCKKFLADGEYLNTRGKCIFLKDNKCSIHDLKPYGGRFLQCAKITGSAPIALGKSQSFGYWANNQDLFEIVFPGFNNISKDIKEIFQQIEKYSALNHPEKVNQEFSKLQEIMNLRLFPLFNASPPAGNWKVLWEEEQ